MSFTTSATVSHQILEPIVTRTKKRTLPWLEPMNPCNYHLATKTGINSLFYSQSIMTHMAITTADAFLAEVNVFNSQAKPVKSCPVIKRKFSISLEPFIYFLCLFYVVCLCPSGKTHCIETHLFSSEILIRMTHELWILPPIEIEISSLIRTHWNEISSLIITHWNETSWDLIEI